MEWDYEGYIKENMDEIQKWIKEGRTIREIINSDRFNLTALERCGIPITYLVPKLEGQGLDLDDFDAHISPEAKWEYYDETIFGNPLARDRVALGLIYNMGLQHLIDILPEESKKQLISLIKHEYI